MAASIGRAVVIMACVSCGSPVYPLPCRRACTLNPAKVSGAVLGRAGVTPYRNRLAENWEICRRRGWNESPHQRRDERGKLAIDGRGESVSLVEQSEEVEPVAVWSSWDLSQDVFVVVVTKGPRQFVVVHVWSPLALTPQLGQSGGVDDAEFTVATLPDDGRSRRRNRGTGMLLRKMVDEMVAIGTVGAQQLK